MTTKADPMTQSWEDFICELQENILPIYLRHEMSFDPTGVHGRMHICRSVIFAEWMARFYEGRLAVEVDFYAIRIATSMHDSGRRGNGVDYWESDSVSKCRRFIERQSLSPQKAGY